MKQFLDFTDRVCLVTGAGSENGIGFQTARILGDLGGKVIIVSTTDRILKRAEELRAGGADAKGMIADLMDRQAVQHLVKDIMGEYGRIDVLVNNAGITRDTLLLRMSEEDFDRVLEVNLRGAFLCMKQAARLMVRQRSGRIVNMSSVVGLRGNAGQVNYAASKAGLIGMTKSLARELAGRGVTVNAVAPGFIGTDMTKGLSDGVKQAILASIPAGRLGLPEEVARAVAFLAQDGSGYITGQVLCVDGGMAM